MTHDEAFEIIRAWLEETDSVQSAYEALDQLWLAAKRHEDPAFSPWGPSGPWIQHGPIYPTKH